MKSFVREVFEKIGYSFPTLVALSSDFKTSLMLELESCWKWFW